MKLKRYFLNIRNWPEQLILSNLSDGNSLNVMSNFQYYPLTLISSKIFPSPPLKPFLKKKKGRGGGVQTMVRYHLLERERDLRLIISHLLNYLCILKKEVVLLRSLLEIQFCLRK